ncbi:uncharacterized protein LOC121370315 [Gigantopelta aegis]|uniref:uncharacterized protein LOC121370315 n=1 Tax=Gigantopelta aegis TaxID=1735272 RepID=UPI001B889F9D|nr:uncharacterized protein LOC121370315 [Gigantopelta aegis]
MADFLKSKAKHWCCNTVMSEAVLKKYSYKTSHSIGSRKVSERCISYSDTFPIYKSMVLAYLKDEDMKSQSSTKTGSHVSKPDNHDHNGTKGLPSKKKTQVKEFVHKNNICCFVKLSTKSANKIPSSKPKFKETSLKMDATSKVSKSPNKNSKFVSCKEHAPGQKYLSTNGVGNKSKQNISMHDKNPNHANNKSKNRIKSIERKMCVKRKLEVLSCKLEENNNTVEHLKPKKTKATSNDMKSKGVQSKKDKAKLLVDISLIPGKRKKREASLNASALVNIYFEKEPVFPKKLKLSPSVSIPGSDFEITDTSKEECKLDSCKKKLDKKGLVPSDGTKKVNTVKEKSCNTSAKLKETNVKKKTLTKQKENDLKAKSTKSNLNAIKTLKDNMKNKIKSSKSLDLKEIKQKLNNIGKMKDSVGCLNTEPAASASKHLKLSTERAARTDRFCLSWVRQPFSAHHCQSKAQWVEGWGNTCCSVAAQASPEATLLVSQPTQQLYEDSKSPTMSMQITAPSHLPPHGLGNVPRYEAASISQMEPAQVIHIEPVQKITHIESEIPSEDRPSSVVDVVGAHTPMKPVARTSVCIKSVYPQESTCVPPCNGYCCSPSERYMPGQYQSMTLSGIGSLNTMQMMSYPQPPYRSAFSVPYTHAGIQSYGFYPGNFYQPNPSSLMQQSLHNMNPCLLPHHVPVQVAHAQVKVLIHNPDTSHDCAAFSNDVSDDGHSIVVDSISSGKGKKVTSEGKSKNTVKQKKKLERKNVKPSEGDEKEVKADKVMVPQQPEGSGHGWSWSGEPEWKLVQNIQVDGPPIRRKCYPAICHDDGDIIHIRDCVLLRSGPRKTDIPFIAKVAAFWEHPDDGEMMMSLLWYYRPEHTEMGRQPHNQEQEIFASKHRDENSVACIEDKAYVLTSGEYGRYKAEMCRLKLGAYSRTNVVPDVDDEVTISHKLISTDVDPTTVFLCHQVYDFRQKRILKNPS